MKANSATAAVAVRPETHCLDAAPLLVRHRFSSLTVVDASGRLVGLDLIGDGDRQTMRLAPLSARRPGGANRGWPRVGT
jgi:CBS-domain-containing membrane protein